MLRDEALTHDPLRELHLSLDAAAPESGESFRLDLNREARTGVPEVIQARGKDRETIARIVDTFLRDQGRAILSMARSSVVSDLRVRFPNDSVEEHRRARMVVVRRDGSVVERTGGRVGIVTAGASDAPTAEQAQVLANEMGCTVTMVYDVGVAGLHRLLPPLRRLLDSDVDVIVVVAGMDGALPSVVAGLVGVPVVGLPTSTGYGMGGKGEAALLSMLQTCAPGLTVVNIDNGVGAGASAARIANRMAAARAGVQGSAVRRVKGA